MLTTATSTCAQAAIAKYAYDEFYPYYAELCATTEIRKKSGDGVPLRSGIGGHAVLYLNGVCRDRQVAYPTLKLCEANLSPKSEGVGISVNSHYKNANWIATDGTGFLLVWGAEARRET